MNIDPQSNPLHSVGGVNYGSLFSTKEETDVHDPTKSTIQQSLAEALMANFLMGWPTLPKPGDGSSLSIDGVTAAFNSKTSEIVNDMLDRWHDNLEQQKDRIKDYLHSDAYRAFVAERSLQGRVREELTTNIDTKSLAMSTSEFNTYLNSRIESAIALWDSTIDGVSRFLEDSKDKNPGAALFIVASFAITSTFIGDYLNIVDVASTNMVAVNPIQHSVSHALPLIPPDLQQQFVLTINLLASGLIYYSNADAILKMGQQQQKPPTDWDSAVAIAHKTLDTVKGDMVNGLLLAMLAHNIENLELTPQQKASLLPTLVTFAKAIMLAVAIASLLKASAPDMPLSKEIFLATLHGPLQAKSEEDQKVVDALAPLVAYFNGLKVSNAISEESWQDILDALGAYFDDDPSLESLLEPTKIYSSVVKEVLRGEIAS